jgi:hypothetical protein
MTFATVAINCRDQRPGTPTHLNTPKDQVVEQFGLG